MSKPPIILAAEKGEIVKVKENVAAGVSVDTVTTLKLPHVSERRTNVSVLSVAVSFLHLEIVEFLLQQGANSNLSDENLDTPLHHLISAEMKYDKTSNILGICRLLIQYGGNVNYFNKDHLTPLQRTKKDSSFEIHRRLMNDRTEKEIVGLLLQNGAYADALDKDGRTILFSTSNEEIAQLLISYGANVNMADQRGSTPLHHAKNKEIADLLIIYGAKLNVADSDGNTPIHWARDSGVCESLLAHGAKIDVQNHHGSTPLHNLYHYYECVTLLIEHGAELDIKDNNGDTPLHRACRDGLSFLSRQSVFFVVLLIQHGALTFLQNNAGKTPLDVARETKNTVCVDLLTQEEYFAVFSGSLSLIQRCIILRKATVNSVGKESGMPLVCVAAKCGHTEIIQYLIDEGADIESQDKQGNTALHLACENGHPDVVIILLQYGANENAENDNGRTPLSLVTGGWSHTEKQKECAEILGPPRARSPPHMPNPFGSFPRLSNPFGFSPPMSPPLSPRDLPPSRAEFQEVNRKLEETTQKLAELESKKTAEIQQAIADQAASVVEVRLEALEKSVRVLIASSNTDVALPPAYQLLLSSCQAAIAGMPNYKPALETVLKARAAANRLADLQQALWSPATKSAVHLNSSRGARDAATREAAQAAQAVVALPPQPGLPADPANIEALLAGAMPATATPATSSPTDPAAALAVVTEWLKQGSVALKNLKVAVVASLEAALTRRDKFVHLQSMSIRNSLAGAPGVHANSSEYLNEMKELLHQAEEKVHALERASVNILTQFPLASLHAAAHKILNALSGAQKDLAAIESGRAVAAKLLKTHAERPPKTLQEQAAQVQDFLAHAEKCAELVEAKDIADAALKRAKQTKKLLETPQKTAEKALLVLQSAMAKRRQLVQELLRTRMTNPEILYMHGDLGLKEEELALGELALEWSGFTLDNLELVKVLATHGLVRVEARRLYDADYVVKTIQFDTDSARSDFFREVKMLVHLQHPRVAHIRGVLLSETQGTILFPHYAGGDLQEWLSAAPRSLEERRTVLRDILEGVVWMHSKRVVHRDLKPGNIFVTAEGRAVLGDFGISKVVDATTLLTMIGGGAAGSGRGMAGTLLYLAPELKPPHNAQHSPRTDLFALGLIIRWLFESAPLNQAQRQVVDALVAQLTSTNPEERPTATQVLANPLLLDSSNSVLVVAAGVRSTPMFWKTVSTEALTAWATKSFPETEAHRKAVENAMHLTGLRSAKVTKLTRLENVPGFEIFKSGLRKVLSLSNGDCVVRVGVLTESALGEMWEMQELDEKGNEVMLWHGTTTSAIQYILSQLLDHRSVGTKSGALFGEGLYFAENSQKANFYAHPAPDGTRVMLVCRVILGVPYHTNAQLPPNTRRAPINATTGQPFDSVVAAAGASSMTPTHGAHREFVVFDHSHAYPQYLVEYRV